MYVVFLEQRKRTEMWRVSWVGGCGGRELPWQMKRCHHWKCAGAWSFFFLSPDVHGCRWGIAKPYSIRSRLKERICWESGGTFFSDEGESSLSRRTISRQGRGRHGPTISRQRLHLVRLSKKSRKCPGVDHLPRRGTPRDDGDEKLSWRYQQIWNDLKMQPVA